MVINTLHNVRHSKQARSRLILDKCHKNFRLARVIRTRFTRGPVSPGGDPPLGAYDEYPIGNVWLPALLLGLRRISATSA